MLLIVDAVELTLDAVLATVFSTDISLSALKTKLMLSPVTVTYATRQSAILHRKHKNIF